MNIEQQWYEGRNHYIGVIGELQAIFEEISNWYDFTSNIPVFN